MKIVGKSSFSYHRADIDVRLRVACDASAVTVTPDERTGIIRAIPRSCPWYRGC